MRFFSGLPLRSHFLAITLSVFLSSAVCGQTPSTEKGWFDLGLRQREKYQFAESIVSLTEGLRLNPKSSPCLALRGLSYWNLSKHDLAKQDLDAAIRLKPDAYLPYQYRGEFFFSLRSSKGRIDAAIADFTKAIQLKPEYAPAYRARGECYEYKGELGLAISDVSKAIELNPKSTDAKRVMERLKASNPKAAAIKSATNPPNFPQKTAPPPAVNLSEKEKAELATEYVNYALLNFQTGKYEAAVADFTKYLRVYPDKADGFYNRGVSYARWGKTALAMADLEQALKLQPDFLRAKTELERLKRAKAGEIVTSIAQITDVKPTDEFYGDLQSLIERYGISKIAVGGRFQPNQPLTMFEYADFLKQGKEYLKNAASGFGIKEVNEEELFNSKCTLPYLGTIPEKEIAKSLSCHFRIKNFPASTGENGVTRGRFAMYFNKAIQQASLEYLLKSQSDKKGTPLKAK